MRLKTQNRSVKVLLLLLALLLIAGLSGWSLHRYTNVFHNHNIANRLPGIDYSPAKPRDNAANNKAKQSGQLDNNNSAPTSTDKNIGITFVAAGQDQVGGPVIVKVLLQNIADGICHLTLKQGSSVVDKTANVIRQSNYYTCDGFSIPFSDVQVGSAQLTLTLTATNGASNYATKDITIN